MRISVAMCTYNGSAYVEEQLQSIARQARLPDELVVCDDHSRDDTVSIVEAFASAAAFPVRLLVNDENLGFVRNFDQAIRLCAGDIIVLSDQDDVWRDDKLAAIADAFGRSDSLGVAFSDAEVVDSELQPLGHRLWDAALLTPSRREEILAGHAFDRLLRNQLVTGATMAFRSRYRDLVIPVPDGVPHDSWIALLIAAVADVTLIDEPLIKYRQHGSNQIGVTHLGWFDLVQQRRSAGRSSLQLLARQANAAVERLRGYPTVDPALLERTREVAEHLTVRATLPAKRLARVQPVLKELLRFRYQGVLASLRNSLSDLILLR